MNIQVFCRYMELRFNLNEVEFNEIRKDLIESLNYSCNTLYDIDKTILWALTADVNSKRRYFTIDFKLYAGPIEIVDFVVTEIPYEEKFKDVIEFTKRKGWQDWYYN